MARAHPFMLQLASARVAKGLTQTQVGMALGVTKNCICQWENGNNNGPKVFQLFAWAEFLGVPINTDPEATDAIVEVKRLRERIARIRAEVAGD
jgi:transcriptional regulator with XRE-family HTH domain